MISKDGKPLTDCEDWKLRAGPKRREQWQPERSAAETARSWLAVTAPELPPEVARALSANAAFGTVRAWSAEPEVQLPLNGRRGEPRNTDMLLKARDEFGDFIVAIEAKADEPFGDLVSKTDRAAAARQLKSPKSGGRARIIDLSMSLFDTIPERDPELLLLRYQLFTASIGLLRFAQENGYARAVLLIQEFVTRKTSDANHSENKRDLERWIGRLSNGRFSALPDDSMVGPIAVPGLPLLSAPTELFVAKAFTRRRLVAQ